MTHQKIYAIGQASLRLTPPSLGVGCATGVVFATSEDEARGKALRLYIEAYPEMMNHMVSVFEIPIELLRDAVKFWLEAHPEPEETK